jgi:preprotein translocase subunit SecB
MAENGNGGAAPQQAQQPQVKMKILSQYVRDMSFENALAQQRGKLDGIQPQINVQVGLDARKREDEHQYEVTLKVKVTSENKADKKPIFLIELEYAGLFQIEGIPDEQLHPFLLIECPRMLFPFVRRIVSDVSRDGGYIPLNLDNVDFLALYRAELARQAELKTKGAAEAPKPV